MLAVRVSRAGMCGRPRAPRQRGDDVELVTSKLGGARSRGGVSAGECPNFKLNVAFDHLSRPEVWPELIDMPVGTGRSGADVTAGSAASVAPAAEPYMWRVVEHVLSCQRYRKTSVLHQQWGPDLPQGDDSEAFAAALRSKKSKVRFVVPR